MSLDKARSDFQTIAANYDGFIESLIPHYHLQNDVLVKIIPFEREEAFHFIDLGTGTGVLTELILSCFPGSRATVLDMTENMLASAQLRLARFEGRFDTLLGDFQSAEFGGPYDLAVAGLSIHHIDGVAKAALFKKVFEHLRPGGAFYMRDYVLGSTPQLNRQYEQAWEDFMEFRNAGEEAWFHEHMKSDKPDTLEDQRRWLAEAGFTDIATFFKYFAFVVFGGRKPAG